MRAFLAFAWPANDAEAAMEGASLAQRLDDAWRPVHEGPAAIVWGRGADPPQVRAFGPMLLVGRCLEGGRTCPYVPEGVGQATTEAIARRLCDSAWGTYVALLPSDDGVAVFRDPSGGLDAFAWRLGRTWLVTSDAGPPPPGLGPPRLSLDWAAIAAWCADPGCAATRPGLEGLHIVAPGCLAELSAHGARVTTIWRLSRIVAAADQDRRRVRGRDAAEPLVRAVGLAVEGLVAPHRRVVAELSGGLDSAIVAATLHARGLGERAVGWLNYYGDREEGDERTYATATANRFGFELTAVAKRLTPLGERDFASGADGLKPCFAAVDPPRDRDTAERLQALGATALLTGQGGDLAFFQQPTPLIAADALRYGEWRRLDRATLANIARATRRSAWSVLAAAVRERHAPPAPFRRPGLATRDVEALPVPLDPWSEDAADLPPATRAQVRAFFQSQLSLGLSQRGAAAEVLNPLMSQPVVEFSLSLSPLELTDGGLRDRALARRAFRSQLPAAVLDRRSKGNLTAYYARLIAASLDYLRPLLLDGVLCAAGLLDRRKLEHTLRPEQLILRPLNSEILLAAVMETWVRWWQARVPDSPTAPRRL